MSPFLAYLCGLAGLLFLSGVHQVALAVREKRADSLALALACFSLVVYVACNVLLYRTTSVDGYFAVERVQMFGTAGIALSLLWFWSCILDMPIQPIVIPYSIIELGFLVLRLISPHLLYGTVRGIRQFTLPWGERLAEIDGSLDLFGYLYVGLYLAVLITGVVLLIRGSLRTHDSMYRLALPAAIVLLLATISDSVVLALNLRWIFLTETGFAAFVAMMGVRLIDKAASAGVLSTQLVETEKRLGAIFDLTYQSTAILSASGRLISVNRPALRLINASPKEVLGKLAWDSPWWKGDDEEQVRLRESVRRAASGEFVRYNSRYTSATGEVRYFDFSLTPVHSGDSVEFLIAEARDITDLAEATRELRETRDLLDMSQKELASILSNTPDIIYRLDNRGMITYVNEAVRRYGYAPDTMIGKHILEYVHREDRALATHRLNERRTGERSTRTLELRMFDLAGETRNIEYSSMVLTESPIFLVQSEGLYQDATPTTDGFVGTQGIARDITERKMAEEALRRSESHYRTLAESTPDIIALFDADARYLFVNSAVRNVSRLSPEQFVGQPISASGGFTSEQIAYRERVIKTVFKSGTPHETEFTLYRAGGNRVFEWRTYPVFDANGKVLSVYSVSHDITSRKAADAELRNLLAEKDVMLKEIHHRVKNNLQIMSSLLRLQADRIPDAVVKASFAEADHRVRAIAKVHEKLYGSRDLAHVDFGEYLSDVSRELLLSYGTERIAQRLDLQPMPIDINVAIPAGLIVNELLSNALKHAFPTPRHGTITVSLRRSDARTIAFSVADDGIGMPPGTAFTEMESMGMTLIRSLARQINGSIALDSSGGTRFTVRIPVPATAVDPTADAAAETTAAAARHDEPGSAAVQFE